MRNKILGLLCTCLIPFLLNAQQGGSSIFNFLNVAPSSYSHSMGGTMISTMNGDIANTLQNPALMNTEMHNASSFNLQFGFSGIRSGYVGYGNQFKKKGLNWGVGLQFTDYGTFSGADEWGNRRADFSAADYALVFGVSKSLNEKFSVGVNTKFIYSQLESYIATGLAWDIGGHYDLTERQASIGVSIKNLGFVVKDYTDGGGLLPFDLQVGFSKKLKHLPFRYHITAHHLYKWDVRFSDPNLISSNILGEDVAPSAFAVFGDNLFRHFNLGGEFLLGQKENLKLRFSYNHMLRREMLISNIRGAAGFNGGVEFKIKRFVISYSFGIQHHHGSSKMISVSTDFGKGKKGKKR